ncbi:unnamed protein product [Camellia sinensis]
MEEDHRIRITKKIKSNVDPEDEAMGESAPMDKESGEELPNPNQMIDITNQEKSPPNEGKSEADQMEPIGALKASQSFKEALLILRFNENGYEKIFDNDMEVLSSDDKDTDTTKAFEKEDKEIEEERDGIPRVKLPATLLKKIRKPWKKCLIVRLLEKTISYKLFMIKMIKIWGLQADFEALDIGNGFFIAKFDLMDDYTKVFTEGPWIVMDHYVTMTKWQHDFKSNEAEEDTIAIWIRFPTLPIEYYNKKALFHITKVLGVPLKGWALEGDLQ